MSTEIKLPENIFDESEIRVMPPSQRNTYIEGVIEKIIELNSDKGVTIESIYRATNFDKRTISKHLELLVARRIAYKLVQGNSIVYFKNGRLIHHIFKKDIDIGNRSFSFKALWDGNSEILIYIQENKKNPLGIIEEGGGIIIPMKQIQKFSKYVSNIQKEVPAIMNDLKEYVLKVVE